MNLIIAGVFLFAVSIIVLSFIDLRLSVAVYISYLILVPYLEFKIAGFPLSYNLVNTLLFTVYLYHSLYKKSIELNFQFIVPFLFLYFSLLYLSFFSGGMPWGIQFSDWRASFMQTCFISFIVWNLALTDKKFLTYFKWAFLISISIAGIYGLFLMKMEGLNPYVSMLAEYFGKKDNALIYSEIEARLDFSTASKIQSTMAHPMTWTLILCFSFIILFAIYFKTKKKIVWIVIAIIGFNILISGVRTGIAALTIGFIYFLICFRNIKLILLILIILLAITMVVQSNESLSNLFASFTDVSGQKSEISGSSISDRLDQFQGTLNEIKGNELAGKGYGWTNYYISINGTHPVIIAFESLIFMVLCNSGYVGVIIWILFFFLLYLLNRRILILKADVYLMDTIIIVYAAYATGTGEYGYLPFFAIFYSFLFGYLLKNENPVNPKFKHNLASFNKRYVAFELSKK